ncbi:periplasmic heavy metal sensor [Desulfovibrio aminophilus]|uniref:Spy/CpxP family protein refolding chaperone n=1 Tax=Desulfovibrio aminophilus TaxID=81425 RepID=UPI003393AF44
MRLSSHFFWSAILVLSLVTGLSAMGFAWDGGPGPCEGPVRLDPGKQATLDNLLAEHHKAMQPLRDQLFVKEHELRALERQSTADLPAVRATAKEIVNLRGQVIEQDQAFRAKVLKETGLRLPPPPPCGRPAPEPI